MGRQHCSRGNHFFPVCHVRGEVWRERSQHCGRQNAHSASMAVNAIVELYRAVHVHSQIIPLDLDDLHLQMSNSKISIPLSAVQNIPRTSWPHTQMYFPCFRCEVKCGAVALDIADRQNAHSMTLAVRGIVELYRTVKREKELNRESSRFRSRTIIGL